MDLTKETLRMQLLETARHLQLGEDGQPLFEFPGRPTVSETIEAAKALEAWVMEDNR
ncbi:hypothetical protein LCGC14_0513940 [marine sediment metagenome]|uniref:Uncharacterized protein n=1 Tax=marine sediment metagenome TaxID=412755 RepID=A0A0F9SIX4_9ZZZZ